MLASVLLTAACGLPRDPEGTSERIASTHELRVGVTDNPPWTDASHAEPTGREPDLVRRFAASTGAHVMWTEGSETALVKALKDHELDLVIGGFDAKTQWSSTAGATQPFAKDAGGKSHIFLAGPGENKFILSLDRFLTQQMRASQGQS
ncbi:transporter substrate-binding domain-containing protein [Sphingomonas sp. F9_3S_D5_B_2]